MRPPVQLIATRRLLDGTLLLLVGLALAALVVSRVLPALDRQTVTIMGRSMEPTIPIGSVVVLEQEAPDSVAVGEVVTVTEPGRRITYTHRVVETIDRTDGRWLRTKGDANQAADPALVSADWVVGRQVATLPYMGFLLRLLATPSGVLSFMGLALTLFLAARLVEEFEWERADRQRRQAARSAPATPSRTAAVAVPVGRVHAAPVRAPASAPDGAVAGPKSSSAPPATTPPSTLSNARDHPGYRQARTDPLADDATRATIRDRSVARGRRADRAARP